MVGRSEPWVSTVYQLLFPQATPPLGFISLVLEGTRGVETGRLVLQ